MQASLFEELKYKVDNFQFVVGVTPFSSFSTVVAAVCLYLVFIMLLQQYMTHREPVKLKSILAIHNLSLSGFSLVSLAAICYYVLPMWRTHGTFEMVCDPSGRLSKGPVVFWYYVFFLSKVYEFLDTVFQVLKKKPLQFLHVWHHCTTLALCWATIQDSMPVQWVDITANAFVHVIMYYYYYVTAKGIVVWWKKYITKVQIAQFVWDMVFHMLYAYYVVVMGRRCSGTYPVFHFANFVIVSFLVLFIHFYFRSYKRSTTKSKAH